MSTRPRRKCVAPVCPDCGREYSGQRCTACRQRGFRLRYNKVHRSAGFQSLYKVLPFDDQMDSVQEVANYSRFFQNNFGTPDIIDTDTIKERWALCLANFESERDKFREDLGRPITSEEFPPRICPLRIGLRKCHRIAFVTKPYCRECTIRTAGLDVRKSTIEGAGGGLFATRHFDKDEFIVKYGGKSLSKGQWITFLKKANRETSRKAKQYAFYNYGKDGSEYIITSSCASGGVGRYINDPREESQVNCYSIDQVNRFYIELYASRNIQPGEEIFISYGHEYWEELEKERAKAAKRKRRTEVEKLKFDGAPSENDESCSDEEAKPSLSLEDECFGSDSSGDEAEYDADESDSDEDSAIGSSSTNQSPKKRNPSRSKRAREHDRKPRSAHNKSPSSSTAKQPSIWDYWNSGSVPNDIIGNEKAPLAEQAEALAPSSPVVSSPPPPTSRPREKTSSPSPAGINFPSTSSSVPPSKSNSRMKSSSPFPPKRNPRKQSLSPSPPKPKRILPTFQSLSKVANKGASSSPSKTQSSTDPLFHLTATPMTPKKLCPCGCLKVTPNISVQTTYTPPPSLVASQPEIETEIETIIISPELPPQLVRRPTGLDPTEFIQPFPVFAAPPPPPPLVSKSALNRSAPSRLPKCPPGRSLFSDEPSSNREQHYWPFTGCI